MNIVLTTELIVGTLTVVGTIILILYKSGLIAFGKAAVEGIERRDCVKKCMEHEGIVRDAAIAAQESKMTASRMTSDINSLREDIKDIKKSIEIRDLNNQNELRRIREMIADLGGYVRGMHDREIKKEVD